MTHLALWPAHACLITELAAELAALPDGELRHCHVILPTKRLATWLMALLARHRPAFVPPRCFTFEDFVARYADALSLDDDDALRPLGDLEQELLLAALLKDAGYTHLRLGHEHEIKQVFAELTDWGLGEAAFAQLAGVVEGNVYLSEGSVDTLSQRFGELHDLYRRFHAEATAGLGAEPTGAARARRSDRLGAALEAGTALPCRHLYLVGMTSSQGMHRRLWSALAQRSEVRIWVNEPPPLPGPKNPLALLLEMLGIEGERRAPTRPKRPARRLAVHRADTVLAEVTHALELVQAAIRGGLAPSAIALLVTNDSAYGKPLRALLKGAHLSANLALATPLAGTLTGTWLSALLELLQSEQTAPRVLALATHPLTLAWWKRTVFAAVPGATGAPAVGWEAELKTRLTRDVCASGVERGLGFIAAAPGVTAVSADYLRTLLEALGELGKADAQLSLPLSAWTAKLREVAAAFLLAEKPRPGSGSASEDIGLALSAQTGIESFLAALASFGGRLDPQLTRTEVLVLLRDKLLAQDVRSVGDPLRGLQVLSVAEARYVPFELVIVLGCAEGDFPQALPKDHLIDNYFKTRIGLPGWQLLEAIEDTTFHLLRARLDSTVLLYPATRSGEPVVRSRFIEAALARGEADELAVRRDAELLALLAARIGEPVTPAAERAPRRCGAQGHLPEAWREGLLAAVSASSLESLVRCPYRYLLMRLGVEPAELPDDGDARKEGDWLHDVLEAFFSGRAGERTVAPPLKTDGPWGEFRAYALARLEELTERLAPPHAKDSPLELHVRLRSWPAFVDHVMRLYTPETLRLATLGLREHKIEHAGGTAVAVAVGGRTVHVRGVIDSVDRLGGGVHLITDYKRAGTPDKASVRTGLAPQLLLYAMALEEGSGLSMAHAVAGYWSILKGEWTEALAGSAAAEAARGAGLVSARAKETLEDAVERLRSLWAWRLEALGTGGAAFAPDPSACGFCRYTGVCRKEDPELGPAVMAGDELSRWLAAQEEPRP